MNAKQKNAVKDALDPLLDAIDAENGALWFLTHQTIVGADYDKIVHDAKLPREKTFILLQVLQSKDKGWTSLLDYLLENKMEHLKLKLLELSAVDCPCSYEEHSVIDILKLLKLSIIRNCECIKEFWSELLPCPDLAEAFVELEVIHASGKHNRREVIGYDYICDAKKPTKPRRIIIEGDPGQGKTTYVNHLAWQWATNKPTVLDNEFSYIFIIALREVKSNEQQSFFENVKNLLLFEVPVDIIQQCFSGPNQERCLVIFDGYDEFNADCCPDIVRIIEGKMLTEATVLITTRPNMLRSCLRIDRCDQYAIRGFTTESAHRFLSQQTNRKSPDFKSSGVERIEKSPLLLTIWCVLWIQSEKRRDETQFAELPKRSSPINLNSSRGYFDLINSFVEYLYSNNEIKTPYFTHSQYEKTRLYVGHRGLKELTGTEYSSLEQLREAVPANFTKEEEDLFLHCAGKTGLLISRTFRDILTGCSSLEYTFLHRVIQEYLAAGFLAPHLYKCPTEYQLSPYSPLFYFICGFNSNIGNMYLAKCFLTKQKIPWIPIFDFPTLELQPSDKNLFVIMEKDCRQGYYQEMVQEIIPELVMQTSDKPFSIHCACCNLSNEITKMLLLKFRLICFDNCRVANLTESGLFTKSVRKDQNWQIIVSNNKNESAEFKEDNQFHKLHGFDMYDSYLWIHTLQKKVLLYSWKYIYDSKGGVFKTTDDLQTEFWSESSGEYQRQRWRKINRNRRSPWELSEAKLAKQWDYIAISSDELTLSLPTFFVHAWELTSLLDFALKLNDTFRICRIKVSRQVYVPIFTQDSDSLPVFTLAYVLSQWSTFERYETYLTYQALSTSPTEVAHILLKYFPSFKELPDLNDSSLVRDLLTLIPNIQTTTIIVDSDETSLLLSLLPLFQAAEVIMLNGDKGARAGIPVLMAHNLFAANECPSSEFLKRKTVPKMEILLKQIIIRCPTLPSVYTRLLRNVKTVYSKLGISIILNDQPL